MIQSAIFLSSALLLASIFASADAVNVNSLNIKLKNENQKWRAKNSWVNQLSDIERKRMLGVSMVPVDVEFLAHESGSMATKIPKVLDWRNKDGKNWVSPMLNQGNCGSCVSFAAVGTLETQMNISALLPNLNRRLSPQHLFACGGGWCGWGWQVDPAAKFLKKSGVVDEACMPYTSGTTGQDVSCNQACPDSVQRSTMISDYSKPTWLFKSPGAIKKALLKGPLVTTMTVYSDFFTYSSGIYKSVSGRREGGHAISIVGFDDNKKAWIIRNSWGQDWGESGYAYIDYDDKSGVGSHTWAFEVPAINSVVSVEAPRDRDYISGSFEFKSSNNIRSAAKVRYTIIKPDAATAATVETLDNSESVTMDTTSLSDGRYQVRADALDKDGRVLATSSYQYFYVVNTVPQLSIEMVGVGFDFSSPVKGRVEFDINSKSTGVLPGTVSFHYKNQNGKEFVTQTNTILSSMRTGWRTTTIPNGTYEVWVTGHLKSNLVNVSTESTRHRITVQN